jgi:polysaccharide pyruvyl transferase WcaK-like protein
MERFFMVHKIGLYGLFGWGSLGDLAIQQAMIDNIRKHSPDAEIVAICPNPADATSRLGIPALPISRMPGKPWRFQDNPFLLLITRLLVRVPMEFRLWWHVFKSLRGFDLLIFSGGGQLDDYNGGPFRQPYDIFKWSVCAKLRGIKLCFVSLGSGPIDSSLSWWLIRASLSLADYRSYRDINSRELITSKGYAKDDPIYPDLAFSYPIDVRAFTNSQSPTLTRKPVIGICPMSYYDPRGWPKKDQEKYHAYIEKLTCFVTQLVDQDYIISFIPGDSISDRRSIDDIKALLKDQGSYQESNFVDGMVNSVEEQVAQIANTDIVIATRYHCILFSLLLNKPTIALSYHDKDDSLMQRFGLLTYCLPVESFDLRELEAKFNSMVLETTSMKPELLEVVSQCQVSLREQYDRLFLHIRR